MSNDADRTINPSTEAQDNPSGTKKSKKQKRSPKKKKKTSSGSSGKRGRKPSLPFPNVPFQDALEIGEAIQIHAAGQKTRRLTLFEKLSRSPDSGPSRLMITNSSRYAITKGNYNSEFLELTELGSKATSPELTEAEKLKARFALAIEAIMPFSYLYDKNRNNRIPSPEVMRDSLEELNIDEKHQKECVEIFLANAKYLGLLRTIAGAERLIPIEQVIEEKLTGKGLSEPPVTTNLHFEQVNNTEARKSWKKICFFIAPIGNDSSEERKHSDMFLESLVTRSLEGEGFEVVRADRIADPGMISGQIIDYLLHSALVIADLSFHNPNVFYELAIRHMVGKPTIHLIRTGDNIPFDVKDFRTIVINTTDKYDLVAKLDTYRADIANQVRLAIAGGENGTNPIRAFAQNLKVSFE